MAPRTFLDVTSGNVEFPLSDRAIMTGNFIRVPITALITVADSSPLLPRCCVMRLLLRCLYL